MNNRIPSLMCCFYGILIFSTSINATGYYKGTVIDSVTSAPIESVRVMLNNTDNEAYTDTLGRFTILCSLSTILRQPGADRFDFTFNSKNRLIEWIENSTATISIFNSNGSKYIGPQTLSKTKRYILPNIDNGIYFLNISEDDKSVTYKMLYSNSTLYISLPNTRSEEQLSKSTIHNAEFDTLAFYKIGYIEKVLSVADDDTNVILELTGIPSIGTNMIELNPVCYQGYNAKTDTIEIWNSGKGLLLYDIVECDSIWVQYISLDSISTGVDDIKQSVVSYIGSEDLEPGVYNCSMSIINSKRPLDNSTIPINLTVLSHKVTTPLRPSGTIDTLTTFSCMYNTNNAVCSLSHDIQYQFSWGDGDTSDWGGYSAAHTWMKAGNYFVKVRARCQDVSTIISEWSDSLFINIKDYIEIKVNPENLNPTTLRGQNPVNDIIEIWNTGTGPLYLNINDTSNWIDYSSLDSVISGERDTITITYNTSSMPAGNYTDKITIAATDTNISSLEVTVNLIINGPDSSYIMNDTLFDMRDNKKYEIVTIGTQTWMAENLNIGKRIDASMNQNNNDLIEKYAYGNNEDYADIFGGLYKWNEAMNYTTTTGARGICPKNWHIPTHAEWSTLINSVGDTPDTAGTALKENGSSGFNALLSGIYSSDNRMFMLRNNRTTFWSSYRSGWDIYCRVMNSYSTDVATPYNEGQDGFCIRCIKD